MVRKAATSETTGWVLLLGAFAMLLASVGADIVLFMSWTDIAKPVFVGSFLGDVACVMSAFIGGQLVPPRRPVPRTRASDVS